MNCCLVPAGNIKWHFQHLALVLASAQNYPWPDYIPGQSYITCFCRCIRRPTENAIIKWHLSQLCPSAAHSCIFFCKSVICNENTFLWSREGVYCMPNKAALWEETTALSYFVPNLLQINAINYLCTCLLFYPLSSLLSGLCQFCLMTCTLGSL